MVCVARFVMVYADETRSRTLFKSQYDVLCTHLEDVVFGVCGPFTVYVHIKVLKQTTYFLLTLLFFVFLDFQKGTWTYVGLLRPLKVFLDHFLST